MTKLNSQSLSVINCTNMWFEMPLLGEFGDDIIIIIIISLSKALHIKKTMTETDYNHHITQSSKCTCALNVHKYIIHRIFGIILVTFSWIKFVHLPSRFLVVFQFQKSNLQNFKC